MTFHVNELMKKLTIESINWDEFATNPFSNTAWAPYLSIHPKRKGKVGEYYVDRILKEIGHEVQSPENTGHDRIIDGYKTEIKFSLASLGVKDSFTWNHLAREKDYDRALLVGINYDSEDHWKWFHREDFRHRWDEGFKYQQGGQKAKNDDFFMLGSASTLFQLEWIYDMSDWLITPTVTKAA